MDLLEVLYTSNKREEYNAYILYRTPRLAEFSTNAKRDTLLVCFHDFLGMKMWLKKEQVLNFSELKFFSPQKLQTILVSEETKESIENFYLGYKYKLLKYEKQTKIKSKNIKC